LPETVGSYPGEVGKCAEVSAGWDTLAVSPSTSTPSVTVGVSPEGVDSRQCSSSTRCTRASAVNCKPTAVGAYAGDDGE
jgi:hypothetical protein